jgi:hypothetical protein
MDRFIIVLHMVSVVISLGFIVYVEYQKKTALSSHLLMFSLGVLINNLSYLFELKSGTIEEALMAIRFEYLGLSTATIAAFLFICELFHARIPHLVRGTMVLAFFFTTTMNVTNEYHHLFYTSLFRQLLLFEQTLLDLPLLDVCNNLHQYFLSEISCNMFSFI